MTAHLAHLVRHPIKSVGHEDITGALLDEGRAMPFDRLWAISHEEARFNGPLAEWASKRNFVRGVAAPGLMAVTARTMDDGRIELTHPELWHLVVDPDRAEDQAKLIAWLAPLWPANRPAPRRVERVPGVTLADMAEPYVSILSLASLGALSDATGSPMSRHRFRGNLWVEGWAPWAERDLVGRRLRIGAAELEVAMPITRCRATCANPETGTEDVDTLAALRALNGDTLFGLYATVTRGGEIARGDTVEIL